MMSVTPFAYVELSGTAVMSDDAERVRYWAARIGGRYMGQALAETYGQNQQRIGGADRPRHANAPAWV